MIKGLKNEESGLTLVELLISIALIGIILIAFIPLFVMSAESNHRTEVALDATYLGKDVMEEIYLLSQTVAFEDFGQELRDVLVDKGYEHSLEIDNGYEYEYRDGKYLFISLEPPEEGSNLTKVMVRIFRDAGKDQLEVQYETLYLWTGGGS